MTTTDNNLLPEDQDELIDTLRARFEKHTGRHPDIPWAAVRERLLGNPAAMWSVHRMEMTGGEPDVVGRDAQTGEIIIVDCAAESPAGRRSLCYDQAAWESRKEAKPGGSAVGLAAAMGVELLTEAQYHELQQLGEFDLKTSSWVRTPDDIRRRGGALFGDRRYGRVFIYHNGAESYYAARGFRARLRV